MVIIMLTKQRLGLNHPKTNPTTVSFFVCFKRCPPTKSLVTLLAPERFFTRVYSFMRSHISFPAKRLLTMVALKWLLTSVYSFMYLQISCLPKGLLTCGCGCKHLTFFFYNNQICIKVATNALEISPTKKILYSSSDYKSSTVTNSRGPGISLANTSKKTDKKHFLFVKFPPIKCIYQAKWS